VARQSDRDFKQLGLLAIVILTGLGLSFSATRESVRTSEQQAKSNFDASSALYIDRIKGRLLAGLTAAQDLFGFYQDSGVLKEPTFHRLVKTNSNLNQSRRFVSLAYAVTPQNELNFLKIVRSEYPSYDYKIWQPPSVIAGLNADAPANKGNRQFPLVFTWTGSRASSEHLLGLNIGAHVRLNAFLEAAIAAKEPSAIFIPSFEELDGGLSGQVLLVNPFINRNNGQGLILQLIDFQGLLDAIGAEKPSFAGSLRIRVQTSWGALENVESYGSVPQWAQLGSDSSHSEQITIGAAKWTFETKAPAGAFPVDYGPAVITASVCLLLTGLFYFIVWSQLQRAKRVTDIVNRRTRALKEAHDELEEHYKLLQNLNKDVEESRRSAELANRAKSEFLATMSHELRTPLNAILGFSQLLREQALGPINDSRYIEYAKDIHSSGSHLLSLINDILDLAKLESGSIEIEKNIISTRLLAERVITLLGQQADTKGIELTAEFSADMPDRILGDELRLRQIMINLCTNAVKFTHTGAVTARLFMKPFQNGRSGWVLEIQDTGIGIPEEKQATLFDRFTQVDAALSRRHGGVGLGLAICRELVDRMEGKIIVQSMPGVGTTIRVHLPLEEATVDHLDDDMMI